jgi:hypothetical protein
VYRLPKKLGILTEMFIANISILIIFICAANSSGKSCPRFELDSLDIKNIRTRYWKYHQHYNLNNILKELPFFIPNEYYDEWPDIIYSKFRFVDMVDGTKSNQITCNYSPSNICQINDLNASIHLIDTDYLNFLVLYRCQEMKENTNQEIFMVRSRNNTNPNKYFYRSFNFIEHKLNISKRMMKSGPYQFVNTEFKNFIEKKCNVTLELEKNLIKEKRPCTMMLVFFVQFGLYVAVYLSYIVKYCRMPSKIINF